MKGRQVMRTVRTPRVCRIGHDRGVRRDQRIGLLVIVTGVFMLSLDVTMLDIVLPDFATAIGADQTQISWIADCYNVALAGLILVGAGLGGRFGQRRVYLIGLVTFGVGGLAAALVSDPVALIAARTVMGIGAAGLAAPAVALTGLMFTGEQRTRALAAWAAASGIRSVPAPRKTCSLTSAILTRRRTSSSTNSRITCTCAACRTWIRRSTHASRPPTTPLARASAPRSRSGRACRC